MARALTFRTLLGQRPATGVHEQDRASRPIRPRGPLIWFHIGNSGNHRAITALAERFASDGDLAVFLVTGSLLDPGVQSTSPHVIFQHEPPDTQSGARDFLDHWQPDMVFWMQDALMPLLLAESVARGCVLIGLNARQPSASGWSGPWKRSAPRALVPKFKTIMAVDDGAAAQLQRVGYESDQIQVTGALEEESVALRCNEAEQSAMAALLGARPVWFASDLATAEVAEIAQAYQRASKRGYRLLMVITPTDITDVPAIADDVRALGLTVGIRSDGDDPDDDMQVYIADLEGEHGLWYRLAPITFMGGTLSGTVSRSPFEAAALGSVVVHGPMIGKHGMAYERLTAAGACRAANTTERLSDAVGLMNSPDRLAKMAQAGWTVVTEGAEVANLVLATIRTHLDEKGA